MSHEHHDHNHEDVELITFVDEQGNEELFEVLMEIDGTEEFGKKYVLVFPHGTEDEEVDTYVYTYTEDENGEKVDFQEIPEDSEAEWEMIDEVVATLFDEE